MGLRTRYVSTLIVAFTATTALADQCVLQDRSVTRSQVTIQERSTVRRDVVSVPEGRKCLVDFRVRIGNDWHTAFGEYTWSGHRPSSEACEIAVRRAEDEVRQRVGRQKTMSERILVCKDRPELQDLRSTAPGTVGDAGQFRIHPNYPELFYYQGARCRWFLEPVFRNNGVQQFQGVVCELQPNRWVVVDKF